MASATPEPGTFLPYGVPLHLYTLVQHCYYDSVTLWKLEELIEIARTHLLHDGESNRISWNPKERQIRYYTTLGLLDRPLRGSDRKARYGVRHLLQLLAVKRLQHHGLQLADIRPVLEGIDNEKLVELLGYDQAWLHRLGATDTPGPAEEFWKKRPVLPAPQARLVTCQQLQLAAGLTLTIHPETLQLDHNECQEFANQILGIWQQFRENLRSKNSHAVTNPPQD